MRVLVLSRGVPGPSDPLRGVFELDQARALAAAGHEVLLATIDARSVRHRRHLGWSHRNVEGVEVLGLDVPVGAVPARLDHALFARAASALWTRTTRLWGRPDVVHAHFSRFAAALARAGVDEVPLVLTEHDSHLRLAGTDRLRDDDVRLAVARADAVIAVSGALARVLEHRYGADPVVVPNVVDVDLFDVPHVDHPPTVLVTAGNLIERKGIVELARAVQAAAPFHPGLVLRVIGDGPLRRDLAEIAVQSPGVVELLGRMSRSRMAEEFARADGFALFSRWETFGVVYAEAMAAGLPVLATPCGGPQDFCGPDVGLVTAGMEPHDLDSGLTDFLDRLGSWDRDHIRATARDRFAPAAVAGRIEEVYQSVLSSSGSTS